MLTRKHVKLLILGLLAVFTAAVLLACSGVSISIDNGDFESMAEGLPKGWQYYAYSSGSASAEVLDTEDRGKIVHLSSTELNDTRLYQEILVKPDTIYEISCDIKTSGVSNGAGANVALFNSAVCHSDPVFGDSDWTNIKLLGKTGADQDSLCVSFCIGGYGELSVGDAWFDNFSVKKADGNPAGSIASFQSSQPKVNDTRDNEIPTRFPAVQIVFASVASLASSLAIYWFYKKSLKAAQHTLDAKEKKLQRGIAVAAALIIAFALRIVLSYIFIGHGTDITCFTAWGDYIAKNGASSFYSGMSFADYPPGYMYVLAAMSKLSLLFGHELYSASGFDMFYVNCIKLPAILIDLAAAYIVYRLAIKRFSFKSSYLLMLLTAFSPIAAYISGAWGQIDQVLTVLLLISMLLLNANKPILGGLVFGIAISVKPQALMFGPIIAVAYICYIFDRKFFDGTQVVCSDSTIIRLLKTAAAVFSAIAFIAITAIPFTGDQPWYWIVDKYVGTATSYDYSTVNAYNLYALLGQNWRPTAQVAFAGITYGQLGTIGIILSVAAGSVLYIFGRKKNPGALYLASAYMLAALFTLGYYMHERYLFPIMLLLMVAYLYYRDKRIMGVYFAYILTLMINCIAAFYYPVYGKYGLYWDDTLIFWCSLANVAILIVFTWSVIRIMLQDKIAAEHIASNASAISKRKASD